MIVTPKRPRPNACFDINVTPSIFTAFDPFLHIHFSFSFVFWALFFLTFFLFNSHCVCCVLCVCVFRRRCQSKFIASYFPVLLAQIRLTTNVLLVMDLHFNSTTTSTSTSTTINTNNQPDSITHCDDGGGGGGGFSLFCRFGLTLSPKAPT